MIRLPDVTLPDETVEKLRQYQADVDDESTYAEQVAAAKRLFSSRNRADNAAFRVVREKLDEMCSGARRCAYCEDSAADEVEHVRPKDLYPEHVFRWENYVYACGACNGTHKRNNFAVFLSDTGDFCDVTRGRRAPVVPPADGDMALLDPRTEDPLEYLELDLLGTFTFLPRSDLSEQDAKRVEYTDELLGLSTRDILIEARRQAFLNYLGRLYRYRHKKAAGADDDELLCIVEEVRMMDHPTVWHEMKRQRDLNSELHAELNELFNDIPEALDW